MDQLNFPWSIFFGSIILRILRHCYVLTMACRNEDLFQLWVSRHCSQFFCPLNFHPQPIFLSNKIAELEVEWTCHWRSRRLSCTARCRAHGNNWGLGIGDFQPTAIEEKDDQTWDLGALYQHLMVEIHQFSTGVSISLWDNDTPAWMAIKFHHFPIHFPYELVIFHNVLHVFQPFSGNTRSFSLPLVSSLWNFDQFSATLP